MNLIFVKSLFLGIILGLLQFWSFFRFFIKKNEDIKNFNFERNSILRKMVFFSLRILFLFSLLVFLVLKLQINIVVCGAGMLISFLFSLFSALKGNA